MEKEKAAEHSGVVPNPKLRLLDQVREVIRLKHYSIRMRHSRLRAQTMHGAIGGLDDDFRQTIPVEVGDCRHYVDRLAGPCHSHKILPAERSPVTAISFGPAT